MERFPHLKEVFRTTDLGLGHFSLLSTFPQHRLRRSESIEANLPSRGLCGGSRQESKRKCQRRKETGLVCYNGPTLEVTSHPVSVILVSSTSYIVLLGQFPWEQHQYDITHKCDTTSQLGKHPLNVPMQRY